MSMASPSATEPGEGDAFVVDEFARGEVEAAVDFGKTLGVVEDQRDEPFARQRPEIVGERALPRPPGAPPLPPGRGVGGGGHGDHVLADGHVLESGTGA